MKYNPKIQLKTVFTHPQHGGEETSIQLYEMRDGIQAEVDYKKEREEADKSGGIYSAQLSIVFVKY